MIDFSEDFVLFDGPVCPTGAACPDFSVSAPPLRLGVQVYMNGLAGYSIVYGIDNWTVKVWRR